MPVKECTMNGKPGYKWNELGECYIYNPFDEASRSRARGKAMEDGKKKELKEKFIKLLREDKIKVKDVPMEIRDDVIREVFGRKPNKDISDLPIVNK
jgi:hypothetical protein